METCSTRRHDGNDGIRSTIVVVFAYICQLYIVYLFTYYMLTIVRICMIRTNS